MFSLVLVIPIHLIWHIKINFHQKIVLGLTLCLSIVMIIIAIIRIAAIRIGPSATDLVWEFFWSQMEACTAVIMVSFSAFRSVFVAHDNRVREERHRNRLWYADKKNLLRSVLRRRKIRSESEETDQLPEIPRATLTGMHTLIKGGKFKVNSQSASWSSEGRATLANSEPVEEIRKTSFPTGSDQVSSSSSYFIFPTRRPLWK